MQFSEVLDSLTRYTTARSAQDAIRAVHGRGSTSWLSDTAGIAPRTARRWMSPAYPRGRTTEIIQAAMSLGVAHVVAEILRYATAIDAGRVEVYYKATGRAEGTRGVGTITVGARNGGYLAQCVRDLHNNVLDGATEAFSDTIICGYEDGLEETLGISEYLDGVNLQL